MAAPPAAPATNPYHEGSLIYALTTPPERASKLAHRWKGPFRICRIPNEYQVTYEDDGLERTIHINHAKPAKFTAPDFPEPVPPAKVPHPPLGYLPAGFARKSTKPRAPPINPNEAPMAPPVAPAVPIARPPTAAPAISVQNPHRPPPVSQTQSWARSSSRYFKPPSRPPASFSAQIPHSKPLQDGPHLPTHHWIHWSYGTKGEPPSPSPAFDWWTSSTAKASTSAPWNILPTLSPRLRTQPLTLRWEATSPAQDSPAFTTSWEQPCGSCCHPTGPSSATPHLFAIICHARDGVQSYEGVMLPDGLGKTVSSGSPTPAPTPSRDHDKKTEKEEEENHPPASQPSRIPRKYGPDGERGSITSSIFQEPMETRLESTSDPGGWSGCHRSIPSVLSIHSIHSIPAQQPMRIHPGSISRTKLTTAGFISRPHQAGSRNPPNDLVKTTSPDHLPPSALNGLVETTSPGPHHIPELAKALTQS